MTIAIYRSNGMGSRSTVGTYENIADALAYLATLGEMFVEEDADHPGCYDAFVYATSTVYAVQPVGFRLPSVSRRPGDMAAEYAEETGIDYATALVHCNMD